MEGAVIVGSILLAFGIDAWWEGVGERKEQRRSLVEMLSNLAADSLDHADMLRNATVWRDAAMWALDHLGDENMSDDSAAVALSPLFRLSARPLSVHRSSGLWTARLDP